MALLGIDLGGTKLALAVFSHEGDLMHRLTIPLKGRSGKDVGDLLISTFVDLKKSNLFTIESIGVSVPGIYRAGTGTVWAPNIPGWEDYPLFKELENVSGNIHIKIDSDRACCILGELWKGNAQECRDAIFLTVGTGIGAGILIDGHVLRGANDIAGAIGWLGMKKPFNEKYASCGCFEYAASGNGIRRLSNELISDTPDYEGELKNIPPEKRTAHVIFEAFRRDDVIAKQVLETCIEDWGMAAANLVSLFNPEKIIFGGGIFGPAISLIPQIKKEATKWAQPVSMTRVKFESSALQGDAGLYGAAYLALKNNSTKLIKQNV